MSGARSMWMETHNWHLPSVHSNCLASTESLALSRRTVKATWVRNYTNFIKFAGSSKIAFYYSHCHWLNDAVNVRHRRPDHRFSLHLVFGNRDGDVLLPSQRRARLWATLHRVHSRRTQFRLTFDALRLWHTQSKQRQRLWRHGQRAQCDDPPQRHLTLSHAGRQLPSPARRIRSRLLNDDTARRLGQRVLHTNRAAN